MVETSKDLVSKVSGEARIEMLGRNWLSHDAQWQMAVVQSFGWDAGNQLNQKVTRDMGKTMMLRYLNSAGISGVENIKQLRDLMIIVVSSNWSLIFEKNRAECTSANSILYEIQHCKTYSNMLKVNATDKYECGCFALRSGFADALKLEVSQECKSCLMKGDKKCEIILKVEKW